MCVLSAVSGQDVRAADCNPFVKKGQSPFLTVSKLPHPRELFVHLTVKKSHGRTCCLFSYQRQHRTIASASLRRLFAPLLQFEKPEIHTGFETVEKGLCPFLTKGLQSAARTICTPLAYKSHTCSLSCIFCQVHAPTENDQNPFAACGRQTLRGFFDTLKYIQDSFVFQTLNWGKNPV